MITCPLYLPAWSGAGTAYDDDLPPPPATVVVSGAGFDPVSGATWERIGQRSRAMHRTQGMGRWPGTVRDWPLHLVGGGPEDSVTDGLPAIWVDLGWPGGARLDALVTEMVDALAHPDVILSVAPEALGLIPEDDTRGDRLRLRLHRALFLAAGAEARGWAEAATVRPGVAVPIRIETRAGALDGLHTRLDRPPAARRESVSLEPQAEVVNLTKHSTVLVRVGGGTLDLPEGWRQDGATLRLPTTPGLHEVPVLRDGAPARLITEISAPHVSTRVLARPAILRLRPLEVAVPDERIAVFGAGRDRVAHWLRR